MTPPIFAAVDVAPVRALLKSGNGPLRFWMFGMAPQGVQHPYAVWQLVSGYPEIYLGDRPDVDSLTVQIDVYASGPQGPGKAREVAEAIRDAIEGSCYITSWRGESVDPDTGNWRVSFDCDWIAPR